MPLGVGMLSVFTQEHSLNEGDVDIAAQSMDSLGWAGVDDIGQMPSAPCRSEYLNRFDLSAILEDDCMARLQLSPKGSLWYPQLDCTPRVEPTRAFTLLQAIPETEPSVFQWLPEQTHLVIFIGQIACCVRPFGELKGIVEIETESSLDLLKE
jgi:hypothetical protein